MHSHGSIFRHPHPYTTCAASVVRRVPSSLSAPALTCTTAAPRVSRPTREHKHECTDHLRKGIKKKGAVISRELARVHYKVAKLMMHSLQAAKFQESETHCKQALHLH